MPTPFATRLLRAVEGAPAGFLPMRHRWVLTVLACAGDAGEHPSLAILAARVGFSKSPLCRTLRELEAARWIARESTTRDDGGQGPTRYTVRLSGGPVVREARPGRCWPPNPLEDQRSAAP